MRISKKIIDALENCKVITLGTVGVDSVDVKAATARGIPVTNVPDTFIEEVTERNYLDDLNPRGKQVVSAYIEPSLAEVAPETRYQFERHGYFVADLRDSMPGAVVFNRSVTLRDSWAHKPATS